MDTIELTEILPRKGETWEVLFKVGDRHVVLGISNTLLEILKIQPTENVVKLFFQQFGKMKIQLMLAENNLEDYSFQTYDYLKENGENMSIEEFHDFLNNQIIAAVERRREIGFKLD